VFIQMRPYGGEVLVELDIAIHTQSNNTLG
jgi:hypothetical protein